MKKFLFVMSLCAATPVFAAADHVWTEAEVNNIKYYEPYFNSCFERLKPNLGYIAKMAKYKNISANDENQLKGFVDHALKRTSEVSLFPFFICLEAEIPASCFSDKYYVNNSIFDEPPPVIFDLFKQENAEWRNLYKLYRADLYEASQRQLCVMLYARFITFPDRIMDIIKQQLRSIKGEGF